MDMTQFIRQYGAWVGLILYFLYREVWPLVRDKVIPISLRAGEEDHRARMRDLEEDRQFFRELEKQRMDGFTKMVENLQTLSSGMVQVNERIAVLLTNQQTIMTRQEATFSVLTDGISDMRAFTGQARRRREPKKAEVKAHASGRRTG